jgi:predicted ATPase
VRADERKGRTPLADAHPKSIDAGAALCFRDSQSNGMLAGRKDTTRKLKSRRLRSVSQLTGSGAADGKTRLALEAVDKAVDAYHDCVWFVELAALGDSALVPQAVASGLRIEPRPGQTPVAGLLEELRERALLVVLDNCEHLG